MQNYTKTYSAACGAKITVIEGGYESGYMIEIDHGATYFASTERPEENSFLEEKYIRFFIWPDSLPLLRKILLDLEKNEKKKENE